MCTSIGKLGSKICSTGAVHNEFLSSLNARSASGDHSNVVLAPHRLVSGRAIALKRYINYLKNYAKPMKR